jgi:hypothetical protein
MSGKNIRSAVGQGGANIPADVATIQYLLNCVPVAHGGPVKELEIDGFAGVLTIQAVNRFQMIQFGWSDGLVEPAQSGGTTFGELKKYDPLPFSAPVIAPGNNSEAATNFDGYVTGKKHSGVRGKKHSGGRPATAAEIAELRRFEPSPFKPHGKSALGKKHSGVL